MSGNLEDMRAYARGYEDGRRSKDADHAAVTLRLSRLRFDGGSHENLHKVAYAIYPCATGWTCESAKGLRDRLIDLLGGVHDHCDSGRGCTRGDSHACGVGEPTEAMTCDVLGNERHKAVCELRKMSLDTGSAVKKMAIALGVKWNSDNAERSVTLLQNRLIHLLGGDVGTSPNVDRTCPNDVPSTSITDELRKYAKTQAYPHNDRLRAIADRIDEQLIEAMAPRIAECEFYKTNSGCYKILVDQLRAECDKFRTRLEEADAAIANWRVREKSFDAVQGKLDAIREALGEARCLTTEESSPRRCSR